MDEQRRKGKERKNGIKSLTLWAGCIETDAVELFLRKEQGFIHVWAIWKLKKETETHMNIERRWHKH